MVQHRVLIAFAVFIPTAFLYAFVAKIRTRVYIHASTGSVQAFVPRGCLLVAARAAMTLAVMPCLTTAQMDRHTADYGKYVRLLQRESSPQYSPTIV
jgi:hypothetical protein